MDCCVTNSIIEPPPLSRAGHDTDLARQDQEFTGHPNLLSILGNDNPPPTTKGECSLLIKRQRLLHLFFFLCDALV